MSGDRDHGGGQLQQSPTITRSRLQALLQRLLGQVTEADLQQMQSQLDELQQAAADGHHDEAHHHPSAF